jgi:hypothetical protein
MTPLTWRPNRRGLNPQFMPMGGTTFSPTDVSGIELWLHGEDLPASGLITTWEDSTGTGRDPTQSVTASKPVVTTVNGNKAARFDGVDDWLYINLGASAFNSIKVSMYLSCYINDPTGGSPTVRGFSWGTASPHDELLTTTRWGTTSSYHALWANGPIPSVGTRISGSENFTQEQAIGFRYDNAADEVNATTKDTYARAYLSSTVFGALYGDRQNEIHVGRYRGNEGHAEVDILDVIVYSDYLADADHENVMNYLTARLGVGDAY